MTPEEIKYHRGNVNLLRHGQPITWTAHRVQEFIKCKEDPVYFTENYVKIIHLDKGLVKFKPYDYQKELIIALKENRRVASCWARQSGKSITTVAYILWHIIFHENQRVAILANKGDTAKGILARLQAAYQHLPVWLKHGVIEWNKFSFVLENGSSVFAAATSSDNIRGESCNLVYIDEAAFVDNWDEFFSSVYPTITSGQTTKLFMTSTPNGLNHFYQVVSYGKQGKNGYVVQEVPYHRVPGRNEKWRIETLAALNGDQAKFDQEYNIEFLGSSGTLIAGWKLKELTSQIPVHEYQSLKQYEGAVKGHRYILVADVSRGKGLDYSAFSVFDVTEMPYKQVATFRDNTTLTYDYSSTIHTISKLYNNAMVLVENNDLGAQVCDHIYDDFEYMNLIQTENYGSQGKRISQGFGGKKTEKGVRTTPKVKNVGCSILKMLIEQNQLIINDHETIFELSRFSKKNKSYEAESGYHDDLVMGLVLFAWLSDQQYFKELTEINTLDTLREKTDDQIMAELTPFGVVVTGQEVDLVPIDGHVDPEQYLQLNYDPTDDYFSGF